jgi:hypothetical protein
MGTGDLRRVSGERLVGADVPALSMMKMRTSVRMALAMVLVMAPIAGAALACGYHDPDSVSFKTGVLNWMYPNSLHVHAPIWAAQKAGELPPYGKSRMLASGAQRRFLDAVAYRKTDRALRALGAAIGRLSAGEQPERFSMVLVESALWAQFAVSPQEQVLDIDAGGPNQGDLVAVTGEPVIYAMRKGRLPLAEAVESGMLKLYGEPSEIDRFLGAYGDVGAQPLPDATGLPEHISIPRHKGFAKPFPSFNAVQQNPPRGV